MGKHIIRTSDRSSFRSCRQAWDWSSKIRDNLEPSERYAPFEDGTTWHEAMATYYDPKTWHLLDDPATSESILFYTRQKLISTHNGQVIRAIALSSNEELPIERLEEYSERLVMLENMLENYFTWAPTVDNFKPVKIEIEFEVPIYIPDTTIPYVVGGDIVVYQGRLDGIVQDPQGRYWVLEHKTAKQRSSIGWLDVDSQCGSYAWAMQEQLNIPIAGIIYSQSFKKMLKSPKRLTRSYKGRNFSTDKSKSMTHDLFLKTLLEYNESVANYSEYLNYLSIQENPFFRRVEVHRNQASLKYMSKIIYLEAKEMLNDPAIYPSPGPFTCNFCRFKEPCISKQNGYDHQFILDELFVRRS